MKIENTRFRVPENFTRVDFKSLFPERSEPVVSTSEDIKRQIEAVAEENSVLENALWELVFAKGNLTKKQQEGFELLVIQAEKNGRLKDLIRKLEEGIEYSGLKYQNSQSVEHRLNFLGTDQEGAFEHSTEIQEVRSAMEKVRNATLSAEVVENPATRRLMRQLTDIEVLLELKYGNPAHGVINAERARVIQGYLQDKFAKLLTLLELMKEREGITKAA